MNILDVDKIKEQNKLLNEQEIKEGKVVLKSKPQKGLFILDDICNLKCIMCSYPHKTDNYRVKEELFNSVIDNMKYFYELSCQGGETLLFNKFDELLDKAKENDVQLTFTTNAQLLTKDVINKLKNLKVYIHISVDGFDETTYESIRVGGSFFKLCENLKYLVEIKDNKEFQNLCYDMFMVPMKQNYQQVEKALDFALKYKFHGIRFLQIRGAENCLPNEDEQNYIKKQIYENFKKIKKFDLQISIDSDIPLDYHKTNDLSTTLINNFSNICKYPWTNIAIQRFGTVSLDCLCDFKNNEIINTLDDAWNSQYMQEIRKGLIENKPISSCKTCYRNNLFHKIKDK